MPGSKEKDFRRFTMPLPEQISMPQSIQTGGEYIEHPCGKGDLTSDGVQFSALYTTAGDDYEAVETVTIEPLSLGKIVEFEFGLTCSIQSSSTAEDVLFKWQARNKDGTWVDLHSAVTYAADASALKEYTYSGRFLPTGNFNSVPFDIRLVIKSSGAGGETAKGKTKNSSYIRLISRT